MSNQAKTPEERLGPERMAALRFAMDEAHGGVEQAAKVDNRTCTCHPDDKPIPCPKKYATRECWRAAVYEETKRYVIGLKNRDRQPHENILLDYMKRVERALDN